MKLDDGSQVAVIGGGPAGTFFSYFLLQLAQRVDLDLKVDIFEPKDFSQTGPAGCNMCGGIISETLLQNLAAEGIHLPQEVVQRSIDSYLLHMDVGSVRIATPLKEKRIAAVHRGAGPRGVKETDYRSFDGYLLELAVEKGARIIHERVVQIAWDNGRPRISTKEGRNETYDLLIVSTGLNTSALKLFDDLGIPYKPPKSTRTYICEFYLGRDIIRRYLGYSAHFFLLNIPRLEFAALIPKGNYVTVCLLGKDIDKDLVNTFLYSPRVKQCMPPHWQAPEDICHCSPVINIQSALQPFADRIVFIGDSGTSRLYKDGLGAAYRTAKAAATTAVLYGISAKDFQQKYWPTCKNIIKDNRLGKLVFWVTDQIKKWKFTQQGVWRMVSREQKKESGPKRMSTVLWDTFTGSAPYKSVFMRTLHPAFGIRLLLDIAAGKWPFKFEKKKVRILMDTSAIGKTYRDGEVIVRQGDVGEYMYIIQSGQVEVVQRKEEKEFCLAVLEKGDFFGEMAIFEKKPHPASIHALGEARVLTLEKKSLLQRIHEDPSLALKIMEKMAHRIRELELALIRHTSTL